MTTGATDEGLRDFRGVYRAHYGFVWHALHRFGTARVALDDAVQDVFVVAYRRREDYRGPSPKLWLYGIARRVASNYRRAHRRKIQRDQLLPFALRRARDDAPHEAIESFERYLAGLRPPDRELFVLSELEGLSGPELAQITGRNVQTIYTRVRKLKDDLREHLGELERVRRARPRATAQSWALLLPALQRSSLLVGFAAPVLAIGGWTVGSVAITVLALVIATPMHADDVRAPTQNEPRAPSEPEPPAAVIPASVVAHPRVTTASSVDESPARARVRSHDLAIPQTPVDDLGAQTELLRRAHAELRSGDAPSALQITDEHARRFPDSVLADLRTAVRIEALCELGKTSQARGEATAFLRTHAGSPVAERIARACMSPSYEPGGPDTSGP
ncbi:MAG TPA: sigma-70 family RNA polymerase sigma factor [Nannocystaceae bacterium]|nr:sigma-70 family RNA polymerase sigma factor [Nannocystaceae bacterium]